MRTLDIMRSTRGTELQFEFCVLSGLEGDLDDDIRQLGGNVHFCRLGFGFNHRFRQLLKTIRPDVVHSHVFYASGYILHLAKAENVPIRIAHFRSMGAGRPGSLMGRFRARLLRRLIDKNATKILAVSEGALDLAWTRYMGNDERCQVIYNGLDTAPFACPCQPVSLREELRLSSTARIVINVGKFSEEKNLAKVISVFHALSASEPEAVLVIVGKGGNDLEDEIRARVDRLGLNDRVRYLGVRSDVPQLMLQSDVLLFPSLREGLPGVVLEACAAGTPVIASDVPGTLEIASRFDLVECLSPETPDETWAERMTLALTRNVDRTLALEDFMASNFTLDRCASRLAAIWRAL